MFCAFSLALAATNDRVDKRTFRTALRCRSQPPVRGPAEFRIKVVIEFTRGTDDDPLRYLLDFIGQPRAQMRQRRRAARVSRTIFAN